jgi:hypothetical protein
MSMTQALDKWAFNQSKSTNGYFYEGAEKLAGAGTQGERGKSAAAGL